MTQRKPIRHRVGSIYDYRGIPVHAPIVVHEFAAAWISAHITRGGKVCDIGCGSGAMSQRLIDCGYRVVALDQDFSDFQATGAHIIQGSLLDQALTSGELGCIECALALEVVEHTQNPIEFLQQIKRTGIEDIIISFPNLHEVHNLLYFCRRGDFSWWNAESYFTVGHISLLTDWLFEKHCDYVGLEIVEKHYLDLFRPKTPKAFLAYLFARMISNEKVSFTKRLAASVVYVLRNQKSFKLDSAHAADPGSNMKTDSG